MLRECEQCLDRDGQDVVRKCVDDVDGDLTRLVVGVAVQLQSDPERLAATVVLRREGLDRLDHGAQPRSVGGLDLDRRIVLERGLSGSTHVDRDELVGQGHVEDAALCRRACPWGGSDPDGVVGQEDQLGRIEATGSLQSVGLLPRPDRGPGRRVERVVGRGVLREVAGIEQQLLELLDVDALGPEAELAVHRQRSARPQGGPFIHPVEHVARLEHGADLWQPGQRSRCLAGQGEALAVAQRARERLRKAERLSCDGRGRPFGGCRCLDGRRPTHGGAHREARAGQGEHGHTDGCGPRPHCSPARVVKCSVFTPPP